MSAKESFRKQVEPVKQSGCKAIVQDCPSPLECNSHCDMPWLPVMELGNVMFALEGHQCHLGFILISLPHSSMFGTIITAVYNYILEGCKLFAIFARDLS